MILQILQYAKKQNSSDIHITAGSPPMLRVDGDVTPIDKAPVLTSEKVMDMLHSIMDEDQKKTYEENLELDFAIEVKEGNLRFRVNAFRSVNGAAAVFREIPTEIKGLSALSAPEAIRELATAKKGLVLVVGPTGSGKSTTLAALVDEINSNHAHHILTIEDQLSLFIKVKNL